MTRPDPIAAAPDGRLLSLVALRREVAEEADYLGRLLEAANLALPPAHAQGSEFLLRTARVQCQRWLDHYGPLCLAAQLEHERRHAEPDSQGQPLEEQGHDATTSTDADAAA